MRIMLWLQRLLQGFVIGVCMLIPGLSGGTVAVLMGIYDDLLQSVAVFHKQPKQSMVRLSAVGMGGVIGFVIMSDAVRSLLSVAYMQTVYLFMGVVLGGLLLQFIDTGGMKNISIPMIAVGLLTVFLLTLLPKDILHYSGDVIIVRLVFFVLAGLLLGAALILPGISFSLMLVTLGMYEEFLSAISGRQWSVLLPLMFSVMFGVLVLAKVLSVFMKQAPKYCNSLILGFVAASIAEIFPGVPTGTALPVSLILFLIGVAVCIFGVNRIKKRAA